MATTLPSPYKYVIVEKGPATTQSNESVPEFIAFDALEDPIPLKARKTLLERMSIGDLKGVQRVISAVNEGERVVLQEAGYTYFQYYLVNVLVADHAPKYSLSLRLGRPADARQAVREMNVPSDIPWDTLDYYGFPKAPRPVENYEDMEARLLQMVASESM
ncbi:hypothetical protein TWF730_010527 [Orbilia blumenaviensis]|uniref:Uncharacterized protein n=1 Tax=Orbilia blumenaviensis TaxID=1796055 RepID=A0AAV9UNG1_9PEZI